jgi:hypothetical protein
MQSLLVDESVRLIIRRPVKRASAKSVDLSGTGQYVVSEVPGRLIAYLDFVIPCLPIQR